MEKARSGARVADGIQELSWKPDAALDCVQAIMSCREPSQPATSSIIPIRPSGGISAKVLL